MSSSEGARNTARTCFARSSEKPTSVTSFSRTAASGVLPSLSAIARVPATAPSGTPNTSRSICTSPRSDTRATKSSDVKPSSRSPSIATARISASAAKPASPIRSTFHWKCSFSRPRCCRSYRNSCGRLNQRIGLLIPLLLAPRMRASDGVISGLRDTSRSPLSVKE